MLTVYPLISILFLEKKRSIKTIKYNDYMIGEIEVHFMIFYYSTTVVANFFLPRAKESTIS